MRTLCLVLLLSSGLAAQAGLPRQDSLTSRLRAQLDGLAALGWAGSLMVAHGEEVLFAEGFGLADRRASVPVGRDAISPLASVSKVFTAAAVFELERSGELRLDDPITAHLEDVPESKRGITIAHLLTHSAGMPMYLPYEHHGMGIEEALAQSLRAETRFPPGTAYAYSNVDYTLLGILVEKVSGQPFLDFLTEHVFEPAGMRETMAYSAVEATGKRVPRGYGDEDPGASYLDWPELSWVTTGGGGLVSTLDDLFRFHLALREHKILDEDQSRRAYTDQIGGMGFGWFVDRTRRGTKIVHHGGSTDKGYTANVQRYLDEDVLMVLFLNTSDALYRGFGPHHALSSRLSRVVFGESMPVPPSPRGEGLDVRPFAGRYEVGDSRLELMRQGGHWIIAAEGQEAVNALVPHERASFREFAAANERSVELTGRLRTELDAADGAVGRIAQRLAGWRQQYGELVAMDVLGTTPHWYRDSDLLMTYCRARFRDFDGVFRLHWRGDDLAAVGGATYPQPMFGVLVPDGDGFRAFHLGLGSGARVELLRQDGRSVLRVGELGAVKVE